MTVGLCQLHVGREPTSLMFLKCTNKTQQKQNEQERQCTKVLEFLGIKLNTQLIENLHNFATIRKEKEDKQKTVQ